MTVLTLILSSPAWGFDLSRMDSETAAAKMGQMVFLDARPLKNWRENHIPGALSFSWETYTRTDAAGIKYRTWSPEELAAALGKLGVRHTDPVAVYGDADSSWGGEGWAVWVLAWLGHQGPVYYLDGGINLWQERHQPVSQSAEASRAPVTYLFQLQPQVNISAQEIIHRQQNVTLIDTRNYLTEFLPGHLPGSIHIPWEKFYQGRYRQALSPKAIKSLLKQHGVDLQKPVIYYCTGGIRSGFAWMVHQLSGLPDAVNFEGGTEEWNIANKSLSKH
jgi:thiosulfate/3-mercaptopyruvate sulfurtransferase